MKKEEIKKQVLLSEPLSDDVLKLARAIYNTYLANDEELEMSLQLNTMFKVFSLQPSPDSISFLKELLLELNEPLCVRDFKIGNEIHPMKFINFCEYNFTNNTLEINLNNDFLEVESKYMEDNFLSKN